MKLGTGSLLLSRKLVGSIVLQIINQLQRSDSRIRDRKDFPLPEDDDRESGSHAVCFRPFRRNSRRT